MIVELEPKYLTLKELKECSFSEWCTQRILEICIASNIVNINKRNNLLLCLNRINLLNWINNCSNLINQLELQLIMECTQNEQIWQQFNIKYKIQQTKPILGPEPQIIDPWLIINGYSLYSIQNYKQILDQMICLWYNGPGHNRNLCGRCEYEPSRCY